MNGRKMAELEKIPKIDAKKNKALTQHRWRLGSVVYKKFSNEILANS